MTRSLWVSEWDVLINRHSRPIDIPSPLISLTASPTSYTQPLGALVLCYTVCYTVCCAVLCCAVEEYVGKGDILNDCISHPDKYTERHVAVALAKPLLQALSHLHANNIIHRC